MNIAEIETKLREMGLVQRTKDDGQVVWFLPEQPPGEPTPPAKKTIEERIEEATERFLDAEWQFEHWEEEKTSRDFELSALRMTKHLLVYRKWIPILRGFSGPPKQKESSTRSEALQVLYLCRRGYIERDLSFGFVAFRLTFEARRVLALLDEFAPSVEAL